MTVPGRVQAQLGTIYFSAGYNNMWYGKSTIQVEQGELGNSYNIVKVKGTDKTGEGFSPLLLNYRLGFYFGEFQTVGMEISYDPFSYAIGDQVVQEKGTLNSRLNVTRNVPFSRAAGSYYLFSGLNLVNINFVRRYHIYNNNTKTLQLDVVGKAGVGPALPHFKSSLPVNPTESGQFTQSGWNAGAELGVKFTLYRFVYLELTGKYDFARLNGLKVYNGSARQDLHMYGVIASVGATLPTMKMNPLFHRERKIVTILPFYQHKDEIAKKPRIKKVKKANGEEGDSLSVNGVSEIPEFDEIVDKKYRRDHPMVPVPEDSIANGAFLEVDSAGNFISGDSSLITKEPVKLSKKELRKKKKQEKRDAKRVKKEGVKEPEAAPTENKDSVSAPATGEPAPGAEPAASPETKAPETKAPEKAPENKEPEKAPEVKEPEVKAPDAPAPDAPKTDEVKPAEEKKEPELSKKERKRKEKEERKARKKKAKEDKESKDKEDTPKTGEPKPEDKPAEEKPNN